MVFSTRRNTTRLRLTALAVAAALAGCSLNPFAKDDPIVNDTARTSQGPGSSSSLDPSAASAGTRQAAPAPMMERTEARRVPLAEGHPDQYTVREGDTLWDIASRFLKDPWYWPEVWYINPQIENPHLIYPGDVIALVTIDGEERITNMAGSAYRLAPQARVTPLDETINTIPYEEIAAFLSRGMVLEKGQADDLPYILTTRGDHLIAAAGNDVYVRGGIASPSGTRYSVVKVGDALVDPDDGKTVGYQGIYVGDGIMSRGGDPATVSLTDTNREAVPGDRLVPEALDIPLNFFPKAPNTNVDGRIISVIDGVSLIGQYQVVVINRGTRHGLAAGDVLTVFQAGDVVRDRYAGGLIAKASLSGGERVRLPDEEAGTVMVFKVYDRIGYGLVMEATSDIHVLDAVRNPI